MRLMEEYLEIVWSEWRALGVRGRRVPPATHIVDPESLLLLTMVVARHDPRLLDGVLDWLRRNERFVNVQRVGHLERRADPISRAALSAVAQKMADGQRLKWRRLAARNRLPESTPYFLAPNGQPRPLSLKLDPAFMGHGLAVPKPQGRRLAAPFPRHGTATLLLRLRALCGVSLRCEVLCLLASRDEVHPAEMARLIGQSSRHTQKTMAEMRRSGLVRIVKRDRELRYVLVPGPLDGLLREDGPATWSDVAPRCAALLGALEPRAADRCA